ncbi:MAG: universal stress protein, partial [Oceanihabitans sp.]|nr:universal stress protein [Oceanihabitans sp.]
MKKILVPTDFSDQANYALEVAAQLARKNNGEIYLLHMLDLPLNQIPELGGETVGNIPEAMFFMKLAHSKFEEILSQDFLKGITIHETVDFHQTFEGIKNTCKENHVD